MLRLIEEEVKDEITKLVESKGMKVPFMMLTLTDDKGGSITTIKVEKVDLNFLHSLIGSIERQKLLLLNFIDQFDKDKRAMSFFEEKKNK